MIRVSTPFRHLRQLGASTPRVPLEELVVGAIFHCFVEMPKSGSFVDVSLLLSLTTTFTGVQRYCPCALNPEFSVQWVERQHMTFIAEGGFGNVHCATWRYCEVCKHAPRAASAHTHHMPNLPPHACHMQRPRPRPPHPLSCGGNSLIKHSTLDVAQRMLLHSRFGILHESQQTTSSDEDLPH